MAKRPQKALVKQLLYMLGEEMEGVSELELYRQFLEDTVHSSTDMETVSSLPDDMLKSFYGCEIDEPRFLSLKNASDLGRLSALIGRAIVIYYYDANGKNPRKFYDCRVLTGLLQESSHSPNERGPVLFELEKGMSKHEQSKLVRIGCSDIFPDSRLSEKNFIGPMVVAVKDFNGCYDSALLEAMSLNQTVSPPAVRCKTLLDLCMTLGDLESAWPEMDRHLLSR